MSAFIQTVVGSDSPPIGAMMDFAGNVEPSGWLFCFGQALPKTGIYADLFAVIGTLYGGDATNFNLPDFRGRVGAGRDDMGGTAANRMTTAWGVNGVSLGANGGSESHLLTTPQMPSHTHPTGNTGGNITVTAGGYTVITPTGATSATGGGLAHPNVQPTFIVNKIIKYSMAGAVFPIIPGTGDVTGPASSVDGDLAIYDGTSGKILTSLSSVGSVVQTVVTEFATWASSAVIIPTDDTIPQISEGTQLMTGTITPRYATSTISLRFTGQFYTTSLLALVAIFRNSATNAVVSQVQSTGAATLPLYGNWNIQYTDPAQGSTSAITYAIRWGPHAAGTVYVNGSSASRLFGGTQKALLTMQEIKQ